jgi:hypothetical protein
MSSDSEEYDFDWLWIACREDPDWLEAALKKACGGDWEKIEQMVRETEETLC